MSPFRIVACLWLPNSVLLFSIGDGLASEELVSHDFVYCVDISVFVIKFCLTLIMAYVEIIK